jgi:hypothetical protein
MDRARFVGLGATLGIFLLAGVTCLPASAMEVGAVAPLFEDSSETTITIPLEEQEILAMTRPNGKVKKSGQSEVPGTGGRKVDWKITLKKNGKKSMQVWIEVKSSDGRPIKFVICAMVNLKNHGTVKHEIYTIKSDGRGGYKCEKIGCTDMPPSYHLACKTISLSGGGWRQVWDQRVDLSTEFKTEDIESLYFDILTAGGLPSSGGCDMVKGANKFLVPSDPTRTDEWANIWGGGGGPTPLATVGTVGFQAEYVASVPLGNWVTMGYPAVYPAVLEATLEGLPAGSVVQVVTQGVTGPLHKVASGPDGGCVGAPLVFEEPFQITPEPGSNEIYIGLPEGECGNLAEGNSTKLWGNVYAAATGEIYALDQFMYGISYEFFHDTVPPEILSVATAQVGDALKVDVTARDAATMPDGATFFWTSADGTEGEAPIDFAETAMVEGVAYFSALVPGLPAGEFLDCQIVVYDEGGNEARSAVSKVFIADSSVERPARPRRGSESPGRLPGDRP